MFPVTRHEKADIKAYFMHNNTCQIAQVPLVTEVYMDKCCNRLMSYFYTEARNAYKDNRCQVVNDRNQYFLTYDFNTYQSFMESYNDLKQRNMNVYLLEG